jgi:hypothetical protein
MYESKPEDELLEAFNLFITEKRHEINIEMNLFKVSSLKLNELILIL